MSADLSTAEVVMASFLAALAVGTLSDQPAQAIAWCFSRLSRLSRLLRR